MLAYQEEDSTEPATKTVRMEQRITPAGKEQIEKAAGILGIRPSEFMVSAAVRAARETLKEYEQTVLTAKDHAAFLNALDATEPTADLVSLMRTYAGVVSEK
jgi:uncharacterized protein (DUF1778 family)